VFYLAVMQAYMLCCISAGVFSSYPMMKEIIAFYVV